MIKTFRHKGLKVFFEKGSMAGIQAAHAPRLAAMLRRLNETTNAQGMNLPGWGLHPLKGRDLKGHLGQRQLANDLHLRRHGRRAGGLSGLPLKTEQRRWHACSTPRTPA
jgi:proteic killer suppression protein